MATSCTTTTTQPQRTVAVHLTDPSFSSRVDFADAYVLPTSVAAALCPTATLVSPWLLTDTEAAAAAASPSTCELETVPLAWRCPSCGTLEVEQLYWRRTRRGASDVAGGGGADATAAAAVATAGRPRLHTPSPALQAKLERHRRRRERREEMRWRPLQVSARCRRCYLCPRCGGRSGAPPVQSAMLSSSEEGAWRSLPVSVHMAGAPPLSALDLRITSDMQYYTACPCCHWHSYRGFATMPQLLAYLDTTMSDERTEALRDRRAAWRGANAALRAGLPRLLGGEGPSWSTASPHAQQQQQQGPRPTISQAAWDAFRRPAAVRGSSGAAPRSTTPSPPPPPPPPALRDAGTASRLPGVHAGTLTPPVQPLHPALALEKLRDEEAARRRVMSAVSPLAKATAGAQQVMRITDLAREALAHRHQHEQQQQERMVEQPTPIRSAATPLQTTPGASPSPERVRPGCYGGRDDGTDARRSGVSRTTPSNRRDSEVALIVATQRSLLSLPPEVTDTRAQTVQTWMQRFQPAAVVAQQRKAAAAAAASNSFHSTGTPTPARREAEGTLSEMQSPAAHALTPPPTAAATPAVRGMSATPLEQMYATPAPATTAAAAAAAMTTSSALLHTPTSAYLHSVLLQEQDHALGLPSYYVPRSRKEVLTGVVWRPRRETGQEANAVTLVLLDRSALSDAELATVCQHWADARAAEAERQRKRQQLHAAPAVQRVAKSPGAESSEDTDDGGDEERKDATPAVAEGSATTAAASSSSAAPSLHRRGAPALAALPRFVDGSCYAALSSLPYVEPILDGEWPQLRMLNLHLCHDMYVTKVGVQYVVPDAGDVQLHLASYADGAAAVELPIALAPRCSAAERCAALALTAVSAEQQQRLDTAASGLALPAFLDDASRPPPARVPELRVVLHGACGSSSNGGVAASAPPRCVALLLEVATALPGLGDTPPQYHAVQYGLTVTLD